MFGFGGRAVLTRIYCGSKIKGWPSVENRTSSDLALRIEKEKGSALCLNSISGVLAGVVDGRGTTDSGTSYRSTAGSMILT